MRSLRQHTQACNRKLPRVIPTINALLQQFNSLHPQPRALVWLLTQTSKAIPLLRPSRASYQDLQLNRECSLRCKSSLNPNNMLDQVTWHLFRSTPINTTHRLALALALVQHPLLLFRKDGLHTWTPTRAITTTSIFLRSRPNGNFPKGQLP